MSFTTNPFVPGMLKCPVCSFTLQRSLLSAATGAVSVDTSPTIEACPNDAEIMQPVTWRQRCLDLAKVAEGQILRAVEAERQRDEAWKALNAAPVIRLGEQIEEFKVRYVAWFAGDRWRAIVDGPEGNR